MKRILLMGFLSILIPVWAGSVGPVEGGTLSVRVEAGWLPLPVVEKEPEAEETSGPEREPGFLESVKAKTLGWVHKRFGFLIEEVDRVFGFDPGGGLKALFGTMFYTVLILIGLFVVKFFYNIVRDILGSLLSRDEKRPR